MTRRHNPREDNQRMINRIAVGVVWVQGPGDELTMTGGDLLDTAVQVQEAQTLLQSLEPDARISWHVEQRIVELTSPAFPDPFFRGMPLDFYIKPIDAAFWDGNAHKTFLFVGDQFIRLSGRETDDGFPQSIASHFTGLPAGFQERIDAAFWRQLDGKLYFFKGAEYVRLTGTHVDSGYPKPYAGSWSPMPDGFANRLDAAMCDPTTDKMYFFVGDKYVVSHGNQVDGTRYPRSIADEWQGLPELFASHIHAAVVINSRAYLFGHSKSQSLLNEYARFTALESTVDEGYPAFVGGLDRQAVNANWRFPAQVALGYPGTTEGLQDYIDDLIEKLECDHGMVAFITRYPCHWFAFAGDRNITMRWDGPNENFDRVVAHETCHVFGAPDEYGSCECTELHGKFLRSRNLNCSACTIELGAIADSLTTIAAQWQSLPASFGGRIDAAVELDAPHRLMFRGDQVVRMSGGQVDAGYPRAINQEWGVPSAFAGGIDAALFHPQTNKLTFFKGASCVEPSTNPLAAHIARPITDVWAVPAPFASGIDAALWRPATSSIIFFKDEYYIQIVGGTVAARRRLADHWHQLPSSYYDGIDAALMRSSDDTVYLFDGGQSVRVGVGINCLMTNNRPIACPFTHTHIGWESFLAGIDAALHVGDDDFVHFFSGRWCLGASFDRKVVLRPQPIEVRWKGLPRSFHDGIDAAYWDPRDERTYLFKGRIVVRLTGDTVDDGFPQRLTDRWPALPASFATGIDAALWLEDSKFLLFFRGDQFVLIADQNVGAPIATSGFTGMPSSFASRIDAAFTRHGTGRVYFFHGRKFVRIGDQPKDIDGHWMPFPRD